MQDQQPIPVALQAGNLPPTEAELLTVRAEDYSPHAVAGHYYLMRSRPVFGKFVITEMLTDPKISYGLWLIKGPILSSARFFVDCKDQAVKDFLIAQINRFWQNSAVLALKAIEWGRVGCEVMYRQGPEGIEFDSLKDFEANDIRIVTYGGNLAGITVDNVVIGRSPSASQLKGKIYLGGPKAFVHWHWRDRDRWNGLSRLFGCYIPWWETWSDGGYRDIRRLWFYKNAYESGTIYHPPGSSRQETGQIVANKELARELIEKKRTGATLTLPNTLGADNAKLWEYLPPTPTAAPEGLLDYGKVLSDEILEGLGIPPEVIQSSGETGFGSSTGRQVPQTAFYSSLQELVSWLILDFDTQVLRYLVRLRFGEVPYEIVPFPLLKDDSPPPGNGQFNGNQFQDENANPNSDGSPLPPGESSYDNMTSNLKAKAKAKKLQMSHPAPSPREEAAPVTNARWITIGGRQVGDKNHVGGFQVQLNKDGKIVKGGPPSLRGIHVSESGPHLARLSDRRQRSPVKDSPDRATHGLPPSKSDLATLLQEAVGEDPEDQAGFLEYLKDVHGEHLEQVRSLADRPNTVSRPVRTYAAIKTDSIGPALEKAGIKDPEIEAFLTDAAKTGKFKDQRDLLLSIKRVSSQHQKKLAKNPDASPLQAFKSNLDKRGNRNQTAGNWNQVVRETAETYKVDPKEFSTRARELHDDLYGNVSELNQIRGQILKSLGMTRSQLSEVDYASIPRFDELVMDSAGLYTQLGFLNTNTNDGNLASERLYQFLLSPENAVPKKTDPEFIEQVLGTMGIDTGSAQSKPLHHPDIVDAAFRRWTAAAHQDDPSFDPSEFSSDDSDF